MKKTSDSQILCLEHISFKLLWDFWSVCWGNVRRFCCEDAKATIRRANWEKCWRNRRLGRPIATFEKNENQEHPNLWTFGRTIYSPSFIHNARIYAQPFWNDWFDNLSLNLKPEIPLNPKPRTFPRLSMGLLKALSWCPILIYTYVLWSRYWGKNAFSKAAGLAFAAM